MDSKECEEGRQYLKKAQDLVEETTKAAKKALDDQEVKQGTLAQAQAAVVEAKAKDKQAEGEVESAQKAVNNAPDILTRGQRESDLQDANKAKAATEAAIAAAEKKVSDAEYDVRWAKEATKEADAAVDKAKYDVSNWEIVVKKECE